MPSQAARARALARGPGFLGFLLAHHWPGSLDRCYRFWLGGRPVWICARCLGLYPVLLVGLVVCLVVRPPIGWWDAAWLFLLPAPAVVDWSRSRLATRAGSNPVRTATGVLLGASPARTVELNMIQPGHGLVVAQLGALLLVALGVEGIARWRAARGPTADGG